MASSSLGEHFAGLHVDALDGLGVEQRAGAGQLDHAPLGLLFGEGVRCVIVTHLPLVVADSALGDAGDRSDGPVAHSCLGQPADELVADRRGERVEAGRRRDLARGHSRTAGEVSRSPHP